jgi:hypothetical protein
MKNLFEPATAAELKDRIARLTPDTPRLWGKMTAAQALAHCAVGLQMGLGDRTITPVPLPARILGRLIKPMVFANDKPFSRDSPTAKELVVADQRDLAAEGALLAGLIERFATGGPACCTANPHPFFGKLSPSEWSILMYKHLDHHLRQFGV